MWKGTRTTLVQEGECFTWTIISIRTESELSKNWGCGDYICCGEGHFIYQNWRKPHRLGYTSECLKMTPCLRQLVAAIMKQEGIFQNKCHQLKGNGKAIVKWSIIRALVSMQVEGEWGEEGGWAKESKGVKGSTVSPHRGWGNRLHTGQRLNSGEEEEVKEDCCSSLHS